MSIRTLCALRGFRRSLGLASLLLAAAHAASAQDAPRPDPASVGDRGSESTPRGPLVDRLREDIADLATAPARMDRKAWERAAIAVAVIAAATAADQDIHAGIRGPEDPDLDAFARSIRPLGQEGGLALLAGLWIAGSAGGDDRLLAMSRDGTEAVILSAGIITPALKSTIGRLRPREQQGSARVLEGGSSFPSGEATEAFAIAAVIAAHAESRWIDWISWSAATLVAWQRMRLDAHWTSDVIGGALIGASVGRWVVIRNRGGNEERAWSVTPLLGVEAYGLSARVRF